MKCGFGVCVQTADLQHLEDFKREMGGLVEETLYALEKKRVKHTHTLCSTSYSVY